MPFLALIALISCTKRSDSSADTALADAPQELPELECVEPTGDWPLQAGTWSVSTEEALSLGCENEVGNGYHVHVGEINDFTVTLTDAGCADADADGMPMTGTYDGSTFVMYGSLNMEHGICTNQIYAEMTATMTSETTFTYEVWATATPIEEVEACEMMVGTSEGHTFPELPCSYGWAGEGWL